MNNRRKTKMFHFVKQKFSFNNPFFISHPNILRNTYNIRVHSDNMKCLIYNKSMSGGSFSTTNPFYFKTHPLCVECTSIVYGSWGCSHDTTTNKMLHFLISPEKIYLKLKKDQKMKDDKNPWGYLIFLFHGLCSPVFFQTFIFHGKYFPSSFSSVYSNRKMFKQGIFFF